MLTKKRPVLVLLVAVALAAVACGDGATAPTEATPTATTSPTGAASAIPSEMVPETPAASALDISALEAAAKAEGQVTAYTVQTPATNEAVKAGFEAAYPGITVTIEQVTGSALKTKFQAELDSGSVLADVVSIGEYKIFEHNANQLAVISDLPNFGGWPQEFRTNKYILTSVQAKHIIANTTLVNPAEITKYQDLTNPKYKGLIGIASPKASRAGASFFWLLDKLYGDELLQGIAANEPSYQNGGGNITNLVAAGELGLGLPIVDSLIAPAIDLGAPLAVIELDPEGGAEIWTVVTSKAPHPNAARLLLNWMMSPDGQQAQNGDMKGTSVLPSIPGAVPMPQYYMPTDESITDETIARIASLLNIP